MYLPEAPLHTTSVTPFGRQGRRKEWKNSNMRWTWGPGDCNHIPPRKDWNGSYYIGAVRASELHDLLNCHHRTYGKGIHVPVGDILKLKAKRVLCEDQVPVLSTWWIAQFLQNNNDMETFQTACALNLRDLHSSTAWLVTIPIQNEIVFWDTRFFLLDIETNKPEILG